MERWHEYAQTFIVPLVISVIFGGFGFWHSTGIRFSTVEHSLVDASKSFARVEIRLRLLEQNSARHAADDRSAADEVEAELATITAVLSEKLQMCAENIVRLEERTRQAETATKNHPHVMSGQ